jgi:acyl carrier protein phosphodiesterase
MNFLAHAWLAGPLPTDRIGGVAGDFVKGIIAPPPPELDPALAAGVMLHRRIDSFADGHPAFLRSRARVSEARRRVGGIMIDMFYDHFLARHWDRFGPQPLAAFTAETYTMIEARLGDLPASFTPVFERMVEHDWLSSYREADSVAVALDRMAEFRLRRPNPLAGSGEELRRDYAGFEADFLAFMPDAAAFAAAHRKQRNINGN